MAFVGTERMAWAVRNGQAGKAGVAGATMLAHILGFLAALIQGVKPLVWAGGVAWTVGDGKAGDAGGFGSAILALIVHG
jgi:hypothetical protein